MIHPRFADVRAILFDLDGTVADTAPDLALAANTMRITRGLAPVPLEFLRPYASQGARGLLRHSFDVTPEDPGYEALREEFLDNYERRLCVESHLFAGVEALLAGLQQRAIPWGVVTNKASRFTKPLMRLLHLEIDSKITVSGDTTPHSKPHPEPLLYAAKAMRVDPAMCIYIGDDLRDIQAGQAAGMPTIAAAYGYCADSEPAQWNADAVVAHPLEVLTLIP